MKNRWQHLTQGDTLFGSFISTGYPVNTELMALAGFDFLIIDLEHGMGSERDILSQLHAVSATPAIPVVRVESHEKQRVHRLLDLGVHGIMFPRVDTAEEARACVAAMRYPPDGVRGVATIVRAAGYGHRFSDYKGESKTNLLTIIQIETAEAASRWAFPASSTTPSFGKPWTAWPLPARRPTCLGRPFRWAHPWPESSSIADATS